MANRIFKVSFASDDVAPDNDFIESIDNLMVQTAFVAATSAADARKKLIAHLCTVKSTALASTRDLAIAMRDGAALMLIDDIDDETVAEDEAEDEAEAKAEDGALVKAEAEKEVEAKTEGEAEAENKEAHGSTPDASELLADAEESL